MPTASSMPLTDPPMTRAALHLMHQTHVATNARPELTFVTAMLMAVTAGHMLDIPREKMHQVLDEVFGPARKTVTDILDSQDEPEGEKSGDEGER